MKIETSRFGIIEADPEKIIRMPAGMPGFADKKRFIILPHAENSPFFWYQSLEDGRLAFVITPPRLFVPDYHIDLHDVLNKTDWPSATDAADLETYIVVNIPAGAPQKMTGNLIAPIFINRSLREAVQVILPETPYSHCFPLLAGNRADT